MLKVKQSAPHQSGEARDQLSIMRDIVRNPTMSLREKQAALIHRRCLLEMMAKDNFKFWMSEAERIHSTK